MPAITMDRWRWAGSVALLTLLYLLLRTSGLDRIVTTDEPFWLGRSANFYRALWQGDLERTFQHAHPGVMTMWTGMVGYWFAAPGYVDVVDADVHNVYGIHRQLREMGLLEMDVLIAARVAKMVLQALLFALSLVWLRRLFGMPVAIVAGAMIALDPFLIAHDRLLHIDGLLTISLFAAVLALADADTSRRRQALAWMVAGALAAVAWLTRSTGLAMIGVVGVVLLTDAIAGDDRPPGRRLGMAVRHGALWAGTAAAVSVALWPVLWVAPETAFTFMVDWISGAAAEGHELPVFFLGENHTGDPGPLFYPTTIAWRLSIAGSIGLALAAVAFAVPGIRRALPERTLRAGAILLLFAAIYVAGMTLGAKKFDRYVLPVYPVLNVIAAVGIVASLRWALSRSSRIARIAVPVTVGALLLVQTVVTLGYRPIYLAAYNPLLGGAEAAQEVMQMGWGEGVDAAARWVIEDSGVQPGDDIDDPPVLRISGGSAPLAYALPPPFVIEPSGMESAETWQATDYYVATIQQWQRGITGDVIGYLRGFPPDHTVWIEGVRYIDVWNLADIPPPPWLSGAVSCGLHFEPWLRLENIVVEGEVTTLWFRTLTAADLPDAVSVSVELVPRTLDTPTAGQSWSTTFEPRFQRGGMAEASLRIPPLSSEGIGSYLPRIRVADAETGALLPAYSPGGTVERSSAVAGPACIDG